MGSLVKQLWLSCLSEVYFMAKRTKKKEYSKIIVGIILAYGILNGLMYHVEVLMGFEPDPELAVQSIITIIGAYFSYVTYSFCCKNSRNRYYVDENGVPRKEKLDDLEKEE